MAKISRKIPLHVLKARRKDYHINKDTKKWRSVIYPACQGLYPECSDLKPGQVCSLCYNCPHFSKENYEMELNKLGGNEMKSKKDLKGNEIKKDEKIKNVETKESRDEKIKRIMDKPSETLSPAEKAWITIWKKKGLIGESNGN